jgi:probable rRNA maturation factor
MRLSKHARAPNQIRFLIEDPHWRKETQALTLMRRALRLVIEDVAAKAGARNIVVLLANDARLRSLNFDFRGQNKPTNVLSFPAEDLEGAHAGDIALAFGVVKKEARAQKKSFAAHAAHLAAHGALHLLGYDHKKKSEAKEMESLEIRLLGRLGVADPYAPRLYTRGGRPA